MRVTLQGKGRTINLLSCLTESLLDSSNCKKIQTLTFPLPFRQHHNHALPTTIRERILFLSHQLYHIFFVLLPHPSLRRNITLLLFPRLLLYINSRRYLTRRTMTRYWRDCCSRNMKPENLWLSLVTRSLQESCRKSWIRVNWYSHILQNLRYPITLTDSLTLMTFTQAHKNPTVVPRYAPIAPILMTCRQVHQSVGSHRYDPHLYSLIRS